MLEVGISRHIQRFLTLLILLFATVPRSTSLSTKMPIRMPARQPQTDASAFSKEMEQISSTLQLLAETHQMDDRQASKRSRNKLQRRHLHEFPTDSLFDQFARAVCNVNTVPRKEVFETWAMALYVHHHFQNTTRIVDLACSHGLLSWALLLLADSRAENENTSKIPPGKQLSVVCVDLHMPKSSERIKDVMLEEWPHLRDRWDYVEGPLEAVEPHSSTLLVGIHACGVLSDKVVSLAIQGNAPLALVPCCHSKKCLTDEEKSKYLQNPNNNNNNNKNDEKVKNLGITFHLADFLDERRMRRLQKANFQVHQAMIPQVFTPKNRIILATPTAASPSDKEPEVGSRLSTSFKGQPAYAIPKFSIPVADNDSARAQVRSMAGRTASNQRKAKTPPSLCMSLLLPDDNLQLSAQDLNAVATTLAPTAKVEAVCPEPFLHPKEKRYARTFRVFYNNCDKATAKSMHQKLRGIIPNEFPGAVVRYQSASS